MISITGDIFINKKKLFSIKNFNLIPDSWNCILGSSGIGKSTLLRLIAGIETDAIINGEIKFYENKENIAFMSQEDLLFPWANVFENVTLGSRLRNEKINAKKAKDIIFRVGLEGHIKKKPHKLSGGERQRVALARTLMEEKKIILLDEPFSALDAKTRSEMQDLAFELLSSHTILLVTHDPAEASRLGKSINIMRKNGLENIKLPDLDVPRKVDDEVMLKVQAKLLKKLRETK